MTPEEKFAFLFDTLAMGMHDIARTHGFCQYEDDLLIVPTKLALIASEVSEALEVHRSNGAIELLAEELADVVIRTMEMADSLDLSLGTAIINKAKANKERPYKHGNKRY